MESRNLSSIFLIAGVAILFCVCVASIAFAGMALFQIQRNGSQTSPFPPPAITAMMQTEPPAPPATPTQTETQPERDTTPTLTAAPSESETTPTPSSSTSNDENNSIDSDVLTQMMDIEQQVIAVRGLSPNGEFHRALFSPDQLRERVINDFVKDYTPEDAQQDTLILAAFGLVEPDFDFYTFYVDLFSEQVAGFYDNETKEMVVVQGEAFTGPERLTYAHEYTHALQDQTYDIKNGLGYGDEACKDDSERCAAIQALLEGDASLSELQWFTEHGTSQDQQDILEFYENFESPIFDSAPPFMQEDFVFPYNRGYEFVNFLFEEGGFPAVDAAYLDPPVSTEQILHPDLYPNETPISVTLPDLLPVLGEGWTQIDDNVMGEWYTYLILARSVNPAAQLDPEEAAAAAAGWGGDAYTVYLSPAGDTVALVLSTVWDTPADASEFAETFEAYATARFGDPTSELTWESASIVTLFSHTGEQTIWVSAPDLATAQTILSAVQP